MRCYFISAIMTFSATAFACESPIENAAVYPEPENNVDKEIDNLLCRAEESLFIGNFRDALEDVEKTTVLLSLTTDKDNHRALRSLFDKAVIVTCLEGPSDNSCQQFETFIPRALRNGAFEPRESSRDSTIEEGACIKEIQTPSSIVESRGFDALKCTIPKRAGYNTLLASKYCAHYVHDSQPNLFDPKGHWPILGEEVVNIGECLDRVDNIEKSLEIACAALPASIITRMAIDAAIFAIAKQAKRCCTGQGFWKTCIQPMVDTWKKVELFGIPPDPYWD